MKMLDNWLQGNAPIQLPPTTITVRDQVGLQGNAPPQPITSGVPGDDQVRPLGNRTPNYKSEKELVRIKSPQEPITSDWIRGLNSIQPNSVRYGWR